MKQRVQVVADQTERWDAFCLLVAPFGPQGRLAGQRVIVFANMKVPVSAQ